MASDVLAFSPTQVEKIFKNTDHAPTLCPDGNSLFHNDGENSSQFVVNDGNNISPIRYHNEDTATLGRARQSNFENEIGSVESDDDDVQPAKTKSKQRALTEKQREAEKLKLHSESQRIMRTGALKLPKLISAKSKASLEEFVKPETRFGNFLKSRQSSTPLPDLSSEERKKNEELEEDKVMSQPVEKLSSDSGKENRNRVAALRAKKLEKLLGKPLPELKTPTRVPTIEARKVVSSEMAATTSDQVTVEQEIVLVKSAKDIQKDKLMERFTMHSQKKKSKEPVPKSSPLVTAASAVDERVLVQMMSQSVEDAKKDSAILAATASNQGKQKNSSSTSQLHSQNLPPGRGRFLLKGKLRDCMLDKMRQRHEVRCELYQQELRDYNERMGIEEENKKNNELESEDEDFEPEEGQASDDEDEGDSGSDIGSDVAGDDKENDNEEDEERKERNLLIADEAEEDNGDGSEEGGDEDDEDGVGEDKITRQASSSVNNHLSALEKADTAQTRCFDALSTRSNPSLPPSQLSIYSDPALRGKETIAGDKGSVVATDNSMERNETMLSDASSYFPPAQIRRSESNVTSLEGGLNNNQSFDDSFLPVALFRADSTKSSNADESLFNQSNVFDEDGFIRTERSNHKERSQKEHDNWIKSLLNNSSTESGNNQSNIRATCDDEVANLCSQNDFPPSTGVAVFCPQKEDAVVDPEDLGFPCSGNFQSQCVNIDKGAQNTAYIGQSKHAKKLLGDSSVEPSTSNCDVAHQVLNSATRTSNPTPSGDSMESMEMLCSAPFAVSSQAPVRSQSSPLEEVSSVGHGECGIKKKTAGRLESPAFLVDDVTSNNNKADEKPPLTVLEATFITNSVTADDDDDDDNIMRSVKKITKEGEDRSRSKRRRRNQLIADSDSEDEKVTDKSEGPSKAADAVDGIQGQVDSTMTEFAVVGFDSVAGQVNGNEGLGNEDETAYSVKLFSESTGSVLNLTSGGSAGIDKDIQEQDVGDDNMSTVSDKHHEKPSSGSSGPRLRRVVLDDEDSSDEDADDEGAGSDEDDDDDEGEGEDGEGGFEDSEAEEEGGEERVNEELLEFRRGTEIQAKMKEYFEDEAELSGSDAGQGGSDDEGDFGDLDPNQYEKEGIDDELKVSNKQLMDENGRLLLDEMLGEDQRNLKLLQEFLIGDDEDDGMQRVRRFIWRGLDENDGSLLFHNADDSDEDDEQFLDPTAKTAFMTNMAAAIGAVQDLSEQTGSTARARLELSQWLQSQQASVQLQNAHEKSLESSQSQLATSALQKLKLKTSSFSPQIETNPQGAMGNDIGGTESTSGAGYGNSKPLALGASSATAPAEWSTMPISHYFKRASSSALSSDTLFRHSSLLKRAAERLSIVADKLREKSSSSSNSAASSVLKPVVDTKNMVFKPKNDNTPLQRRSSSAANQNAAGSGTKRKSNLDAISTSGGLPTKKQKLDLSSRISSAKSFILDNLD